MPLSNASGSERRAVVLDFDGTLADSGQLCLNVVQTVLNRELSEDTVDKLRGAPIHKQMRMLRVAPWELPKLAKIARPMIAARMHEVEAFEGMPEALRELSQDFKLLVHSSNDRYAIEKFVDRYQIPIPSDHIYAEASVTGKTRRLRRLIRQQDLLADQCVSVGDEIRDVKAAHRNHMPIVAVDWGYIHPEALQRQGADRIVSTPEEMVAEVSSLMTR